MVKITDSERRGIQFLHVNNSLFELEAELKIKRDSNLNKKIIDFADLHWFSINQDSCEVPKLDEETIGEIEMDILGYIEYDLYEDIISKNLREIEKKLIQKIEKEIECQH